ncbi:MAG: tRNA (guanosine(37)-N1)-methyltransferase TrmD [Planctomycetes bacterium]|nr:tRNA (guanosine(37)-N1)-methyltransferase TrmD [Planctomycetota bacterium]
MRIDVLTLFPELIDAFAGTSIIGRACAAELVRIVATDIRDFARDNHRSVDDKPFGGGPGMVMSCGPVFDAVEHVTALDDAKPSLIMLTPQGQTLTQSLANELSGCDRLVLLCGHYEGFDDRIREGLSPREVSVGDYVLTGGEVAAMVLMDAVVRLVPGVLGSDQSTTEESFSDGLLEYPQYTRPREFRGMTVPDVLLNGDHAAILRWRQEQSVERTKTRRPDLLRD